MPDFFDIHSHINFSQFDDDREEMLARMHEEGVWTIGVGVDAKTSEEVVELAEKHEHVFATIGVHPSEAMGIASLKENRGFDEDLYTSLVANSNVVAIGECGLDYYRSPQTDADGTQKNADKQKELFEAQIAFAGKHSLPLMIHGRPSKGSMDAYEDIIDILSTHSSLSTLHYPGNVHFFVGDVPITKKFLELGFSLSFDGPITFAREYDETISFIPSDMLMAETDAPFAAPVPHRGKRNEPLYVKHVIEALADIRGEEFEKVRAYTVENALRSFLKRP